jgi:hypothetical protein
LSPAIPLGTRGANLIGGYPVGIAVGVALESPSTLLGMAPELRLLDAASD